MSFEFKFPDIGEGVHEGIITKWLVAVGDEIKEGESVAEVETDKVTTEIPSPKTGTIEKLNGNKGDVIHVGDVFVVIATGEKAPKATEEIKTEEAKAEAVGKEVVNDEAAEEDIEEAAGVVGQVVASSTVIAASNEGRAQPSKPTPSKALATPVARKMAKDLGIDINSIKGTGPQGRVMKEDIKAYSTENPKEEATLEKEVTKEERGIVQSDRETRVPLTKIRKTISEKMSESRFTIPHTTAMDEVDITNLVELRRKYKDNLGEDIKLTYMPFIIKAAISALKELPEFNASLDVEKSELVLKNYYNIGIATDTERGLMVPVVRDADRLSVIQLSESIEDVSLRAKDNKVSIDELRGGSFTITNFGSIGGYFGIPIINFPESGILGLGRVVKKPIVRDDEIVIGHVLPLSLSYDHRIIDGASGARFLNIVKELLQEPELLLLKG